MTFEIVTVPCLSDNFCFLVHNSERGQTALIDASEAAPIDAALKARGWGLDHILLTHHHNDHIGELAPLREAYSPQVIGARADSHRLPPLDLAVAEGDRLDICGIETDVIEVPGHTIGHVAYYMAAAKAAFTADSLMALGCGRLFEGTPEMMWDSLQKMRAWPDDTQIFSAHEYSAGNAAFARSLEPDNPHLISRIESDAASRAAGQPTVPNPLSLEKATNPFLRADVDAFRAAVGLQDKTPLEVFTETRARKDQF